MATQENLNLSPTVKAMTWLQLFFKQTLMIQVRNAISLSLLCWLYLLLARIFNLIKYSTLSFSITVQDDKMVSFFSFLLQKHLSTGLCAFRFNLYRKNDLDSSDLWHRQRELRRPSQLELLLGLGLISSFLPSILDFPE